MIVVVVHARKTLTRLICRVGLSTRIDYVDNGSGPGSRLE